MSKEGGQGLAHLESRAAAFRLQFIQKHLMGREDVFWEPVTSVILRGKGELGMDASVFLLNCNLIFCYEIPVFYKGLFKAWTLFCWKRLEPASSLFWLLEEPLLFGARLDAHDGTGLAFAKRLLESKVVKLRQIVEDQTFRTQKQQRLWLV